MELPVEIVTAEAVKELIARAVLADEPRAQEPAPAARPMAADRLGSVSLYPHQLSAVRRILMAIDEFGGALLSDEVGMGKTFVALAVAQRFKRSVIAAPAVLRDMWSQQARRAAMELSFISFESLSRGRRLDDPIDLVVIDEAHHVRNPSTRRYRELSRMTMRSKVLMLSATPVHNRRRDLTAMLSVFLGSRAESLAASEIARCMVRRRIESAGLAARIPEAGVLVWKELRDDERIPAALLSLPPPVPVRGGGDGGVLVARSLLRQWCSSDAALESALRRRLARAMALMSALESDRYPSASELSAWTIADDSVQMAFPGLVAAPLEDTNELLDTIRLHHDALRELLRSLDHHRPRDIERAALLRQIRAAHPGVPIVAFSQYAETVNALFRELRRERGIAALTARGARVAGGSITRREAISRFAPRASAVPSPRQVDRIDMLLATDLLSEGVNLQDAGVVVHLDLPWTAARLEQRLGRVARLGSDWTRVYAYGIRPPAAAEVLIRLEATIREKMRETKASIDPATSTERIRSVLESWTVTQASRCEIDLRLTYQSTRIAAVASPHSGFLALCARRSRFALFGSDGVQVTDDPAKILELIGHAGDHAVRPRAETIAQSLNLIRTWLRIRRTIDLTEPETALVAHTRRVVLRRVSAILENARPYARSRLLILGEKARAAILGRLGVAAEAGLIQLASAEVSDEEWLCAVAGYGESQDNLPDAGHSGSDDAEAGIVAMLLFESPESESVSSRS